MNNAHKYAHAKTLARLSRDVRVNAETAQAVFEIASMAGSIVGPIAVKMMTDKLEADPKAIMHAARVMRKARREQCNAMHEALGTSRYGGWFYVAIGVIIGSVLMGVHLS